VCKVKVNVDLYSASSLHTSKVLSYGTHSEGTSQFVCMTCICSSKCFVQWKVRRTIALSLHRLAEVVGVEITQSDLLPVFTEMLSDVDEVRAALVQHFTDFVLVRTCSMCSCLLAFGLL